MKPFKYEAIIKILAKYRYLVLAGLILVAALIVSLFSLDWRGGKFTSLETREGSGYSILVPAGWQQSDGDTQTIYYRGDDMETSKDAIIVGYSSEPIPGYAGYNEEEKAELVSILENLLNSYVEDGSGETSASYDELSTMPGSHPQAEQVLDAELSGQNAAGTNFKSRGKLLVTENGYFYFVLAGSDAGTFESEKDSIQQVVNSFTLTRT